MKKYQVKINNMELEIIQDDDSKFITPYLCIEDWGKFGTALKPSFEPIIVARKPFKGSLVDNVIEYGVGGINIDECRVGNEEMKAHVSGKTSRAYQSEATTTAGGMGIDHIGRFPANTILTYDEIPSDERLRYFYCAKASKKDRDEGLDIEIEEYVLKEDTPDIIRKKIEELYAK